MMSDIFKLLIDGELVDGDSSMEVIDPATGAPFQTVPRGSARQLDQAVAAAQAAQPAWAGLPIEERSGKLLVLAAAVRSEERRVGKGGGTTCRSRWSASL